MECSEWFELVSAAADDQVTPNERARLDAHLETCAGCADRLARFAADHRAARLRPPASHDSLVSQVLVAVDHDRHRATAALRVRGAAAIVVAAALVGLSALPSGPASEATASRADVATSSEAPEVRIDADGRTFDRADVEVRAGSVVEWRNAGEVTHRLVVVDGPSTVEDSLAPGRSETATFTAPGTYRYWCSVHRGMEGTVTVDA